MKLYYFFILILGLGLIAGMFQADLAYGAIDLNILSSDGGDSLYFGRVDSPSRINKEVRIRITATDGKQYQVFQRLNSPLRSDTGYTLERNAILAYSLMDSNASGSLYVQDGEHLTFSDQILYISSQDGASDSFTIVYQIDKEQINAQGSFSGEILFTVRNVTDGTQDQKILTVFLDTAMNFDYEIKSSTGIQSLTLKSSLNTEQGEHLLFQYDNHLGKLRVYQEVVSPLVDESNTEMDFDLVSFMTSQGERGRLFYQESTPLERSRQLLYESNESKDQFAVNYYLDSEKIKTHKAGFFSGTLRLIIDSDGQETEQDYRLEVLVEPYFNLSIKFPEEGMAFKDLRPNAPAQTKEVIVSVESNIARPYVVTQKLSAGGLSHVGGTQIDKQYFTISQELIDGYAGKVANPHFVPVAEGDAPLFYSDKKGSPAKFRTFYRLTPYATIQPGDYTAAMVYSLEEL